MVSILLSISGFNMTIIKKILLFILLLMFFAPFLQKNLKIFKIKPSLGYIVTPLKPKFTYPFWLSGKYQERMTTYIEQTIGFRPLLIRINNQIAYNVSRVALANGVIIGKDNFLFEESYINSLWGDDFIGEEKIKNKVIKLAFIQKCLKKSGKHLVFLIAPGKASIYEEKIPSKYFQRPKKITNYDVCVEEMKKNNINFIDIREYFKQIKNKVPYPLFPRCGTHWSGYAITLVSDTLFKYMEKISGYDLIDFRAEPGEETTTNFRFSDNDIGDAMNLLWNIPNYPMYYPSIIFEQDTAKKKPALLSIGDSFNQGFWEFYPYYSNLFNDKTQFWYFFRTIGWPKGYADQYLQFDVMNFQSELSKYDIIFILSAEHNLENLGFGFIEKAYELYAAGNPDAPISIDADSLVNFNYFDPKYVTKISDDKIFKYKVRSGTPATTLFLLCDNFMLETGIEYSLTFKAKGFKRLQMDLYPDLYQSYNTGDIKSNEIKEFHWNIKLNSPQTGSSLRVYMDYEPVLTEDLYLSDFKLIKKK
jgi:hypothetical protein